MSRRSALLAAASAATIPLAANSLPSSISPQAKSLDSIEIGKGNWEKLSDANSSSQPAPNPEESQIPAYFAAYFARFLINYDDGVKAWWREKIIAVSLLPDEQRSAKLGKTFGSLARSVQISLDNFLIEAQRQSSRKGKREAYTQLLQRFVATYGTTNEKDEVRRQIGLLFSMLPPDDQPRFQELNKLASVGSEDAPEKPVAEDIVVDLDSYEPQNPPPDELANDLSALLPGDYRVASVRDSTFHQIYPAISLYEVGFDEEFGQTAVGTPFGPLSATPLVRENPNYTPSIYGLFGISGATGCALTHCIVIPLDVVKTRAQTEPEGFSNLLQGANKIVREEGVQGLLLGAQATLAGYFWYGLSVYPSYTFFKRLFTQTVLPPEVAMVHVNDIALLAGAFAAVIASLGLTPLEAARIRVVAEPEKYRPVGLTGTLATIAEEDTALGWKGLYAGLPSLLTRQVIFGSIKFLAFERASEAIFAAAPYLRDETWTSLAVSLVAGGLSGAISSIVSQPADSVLTYVAQNSRGTSGLGVIEGCRIMIQEEGVSSLFRGLGSRCVWAGSIIAGQFLLYDVFRTIFSVSSDDLTQVYQVVLPGVST